VQLFPRRPYAQRAAALHREKHVEMPHRQAALSRNWRSLGLAQVQGISCGHSRMALLNSCGAQTLPSPGIR